MKVLKKSLSNIMGHGGVYVMRQVSSNSTLHIGSTCRSSEDYLARDPYLKGVSNDTPKSRLQ